MCYNISVKSAFVCCVNCNKGILTHFVTRVKSFTGGTKMVLNRLQNDKKPYALFAFLWAFLLAAILVIPVMIYDKGYFLYYGDFNVQQIPF